MTNLSLSTADAMAADAHDEYLRESRMGLSGAATYWYGQWAIRSVIARRIFEAYVAHARAFGTCTVCEREGFRPWQLDDSGRCDQCRP